MSNTGGSIKLDAIRERAGSTITTSYQLLGGVYTRDALREWATNDTNGDIYLSTDGVTDMIKFATDSARAFDNKSDDMYRKTGTQWWIRFDAATAPVSPDGWFALEVEYV